jgi:hypothetical protein
VDKQFLYWVVMKMWKIYIPGFCSYWALRISTLRFTISFPNLSFFIISVCGPFDSFCPFKSKCVCRFCTIALSKEISLFMQNLFGLLTFCEIERLKWALINMGKKNTSPRQTKVEMELWFYFSKWLSYLFYNYMSNFGVF